jgi:hypothetical protein
MKRIFLTTLAFFGALWFAFMVSIFGLLSFVGPHSAPLPKAMEPVVYLVAGAIVLVAPILAATIVWRRLTPQAGEE